MFTLPLASLLWDFFTHLSCVLLLLAFGFGLFFSGIYMVRTGARVLLAPPNLTIESVQAFCKQFGVDEVHSGCIPLNPFRNGIILGTWFAGMGVFALVLAAEYLTDLITAGPTALTRPNATLATPPFLQEGTFLGRTIIGCLGVIGVVTLVAAFLWMLLEGIHRIRRSLNILAHPRDPAVETLEAYCARHHEKPTEYYCVSARPIINGLIPGALGVLTSVLITILAIWVFFHYYVFADR